MLSVIVYICALSIPTDQCEARHHHIVYGGDVVTNSACMQEAEASLVRHNVILDLSKEYPKVVCAHKRS
jgi:hypothetical protein